MRRPAFQFYPADWRNDAGLKLCSLSARGLWIEMICIMHASEPYGHLCAAGRPLDARDLAKLVGEAEKDVKRWLDELVKNNVCSTGDEGIYSRRMVRDEAIRDKRAAGGEAGSGFGYLGAEHGRKGGRPRKETGDKKPPFEHPSEPAIKPPPSSSSSSSSSIHPPNPPGGVAGKPAASAQAPLPDWIPADAWAGYVEMRRTRKKPMTARAQQMVVKALDEMRMKGIDLAAVLDASTKNCWTDVYEPKPKPGAEQAAKSIEKSPKWATDAGFPTVWEAENALCFERNAHEFRDGKRIGVAA